jgi:hypothetical protein
MNKVTKRDVINMMLAEEVVVANDTYKAYLEHELELLDKKAANKKPTKNQVANEDVKARVLAVLFSDVGQTVTEILAALNDASLSNQRVSALLRQMVADGTVVKTVDKRKSLFALA